MDGDKNDYSHTDEHLLEFGDPVRPTILPTTLPVDSLISHFPTETADGEQLIPRDEQISLCNDIELAIRQGYKYIIVEAPPGIGKSPVAIALCSWLENGYICTSQKSLQFQYTKKHGDRAYHVTGRNNHLCRTRMIDEQYSKDTGEEVEDIYCDNGACQGASKFKCPGKPVAVSPEDYVKNPDAYEFAGESASRGTLYWISSRYRCWYWVNKMKGLNSPITIQNYRYMLVEHEFVGDYPKRRVVVSDEGHNLESQIQSYIGVIVTEKNLELIREAIPGLRFPYCNSNSIERYEYEMKHQDKVDQTILMPKWIEWLLMVQRVIPELIEKYENFIESIKGDPVIYKQIIQCDGAKDDTDAINKLTKKITKLNGLKLRIGFFLIDYTESPENWVVQPIQEFDDIIRVQFKPITISKYAQKYFFELGQINVIMSATISNFELTAKGLGIPEGQYAKIRMEPVYKAETNKLYMFEVADMSYYKTHKKEKFEKAMALIMVFIDALLDKFPDYRGIIHSGNYPITEYIKMHTRHKDRIMTHNTKTREEVIKKFETSDKPVVLCSPSITEGIDLKFDSSRFQIIVKIPNADLSDLSIKIRQEHDKPWYNMLTARTLCQAIGRSVRDQNDWAYTFTLDSRFPNYCRKYENNLKNFIRHRRPTSEFIKEFGPIFSNKGKNKSDEEKMEEEEKLD